MEVEGVDVVEGEGGGGCEGEPEVVWAEVEGGYWVSGGEGDFACLGVGGCVSDLECFGV